MTRDVMPSFGTQVFSVYARPLLHAHAQNVIARVRIIGERERANLVVWTGEFSIYYIFGSTVRSHRNTRLLILRTLVQFYVTPRLY